MSEESNKKKGKKNLIEGVDFEWVMTGGVRFRVFSESYLLKRNFCCNNSCKNCPYNKGKKK